MAVHQATITNTGSSLISLAPGQSMILPRYGGSITADIQCDNNDEMKVSITGGGVFHFEDALPGVAKRWIRGWRFRRALQKIKGDGQY